MKFLSLCVAISLILCVLFTITVLLFSANDLLVPDVLIQYFFTVFGIELGASALIKIAKYVINRKEISDKLKNIKANDLEVDKQDLKTSNDDYDYQVYG